MQPTGFISGSLGYRAAGARWYRTASWQTEALR